MWIMLSLNYENINYVMTQILKLSCVSFSYVSISYVLVLMDYLSVVPTNMNYLLHPGGNFRHLKSKYVLIKRWMNMSDSLKSIMSIKFIEFLRGRINWFPKPTALQTSRFSKAHQIHCMRLSPIQRRRWSK